MSNDDELRLADAPTPQVLGYSTPRSDQSHEPRITFGIQMLVGVGMWFVCVGTWLLILLTDVLGSTASCLISAVIGVGLVATVIFLRIRFHWQGVLPGVLLGVAVTFLIGAPVIGLFWTNFRWF